MTDTDTRFMERYEASRAEHPSARVAHVVIVTDETGTTYYGPFACEADAMEWMALWGEGVCIVQPLTPPMLRIAP